MYKKIIIIKFTFCVVLVLIWCEFYGHFYVRVKSFDFRTLSFYLNIYFIEQNIFLNFSLYHYIFGEKSIIIQRSDDEIIGKGDRG